MSIKVSVYVPTLDAAMLPRIVRRFNEVGMQCQFHPKFALDASKDSGVVFMRLRVDSPPVPQYGHTELLSGFELSFKDFRYTAPIAVTPSANEKLKACNRILTIQMPATPPALFEPVFTSLPSWLK